MENSKNIYKLISYNTKKGVRIMFKDIVVVNKATYLFLLTIPASILKIIFYDMQYLDYLLEFGTQLFISLMIAIIGVYFFIKFNTRSHWMNPDHPSKKD